MLSYQEASSRIFARGTIPDGYFGDRASVGFALYKGKILIVTDSRAIRGWFTGPYPEVTDESEALWILQHHPSATQHYKTTITKIISSESEG